MKRLLTLTTVILLVAMVSACTPAATEAPTDVEAPAATEALAATEVPAATEAPAAEEDTFKVGLLSPGPVNDQGWNQTAYDGLVLMEQELGAEISYVELGESPSDFEKAFRDYASQGYDMVLGHGFQFQDSAVKVAAEYPDTKFFVSSSYYYEGTNVYGINTRSDQAYYLLGVIAGSYGDKGGYVGGVEIPPIKEGEVGFINGGLSVNPNWSVSVAYLGNWTDVAAAKEAALSMIDEGATFVTPNANIAGNGVYQAAVEKDVWALGSFGDQTAQAPENIVASYVLNYGRGLVNIAREVKEGTFQGDSNILLGVESPDVMYISYNEGAKEVVSQEVRDKVAAAIEGLVSGEIDAMAGYEQ
ncbi:MAG: BMP family protein [Anaerolineae bacterium]|nr:BMP family protein [Anaerolineae bacterium]